MPRNKSGLKLRCGHCGYGWFYRGDKNVTSCPICGWRVRARPARRIATPGGDALLTEKKRDRLI